MSGRLLPPGQLGIPALACPHAIARCVQHSQWNGIDSFVTGAGSKVRTGIPGGLARAHTRSWAAACHFLLVTIDGPAMTVRAIGGDEEGRVMDITRLDPEGHPVTGPIFVGPTFRSGDDLRGSDLRVGRRPTSP